MAHLTDLDLTAPADSLFSGGTVLNTWRTRIDALNDILGDITTAEANQVENIATTTISAAQWGYLGACTAGGGQLLAALTAGESTQLEAIGSTTISSTQWGYLGALNQGLTTTSTVTFGTINAFTLGGKLTAGASEIEGTGFDINGGTIGGVTLDGAIAGGDQGITGVGDMTFTAGSILAAAAADTSTLLIKAGGLAGTSVITITSLDAGDTIAFANITALVASGNLDIGAHGFTANTLTADGLTPGQVVIAGAGGLLGGDTDLTFSGDTLTVTKLGAFQAAGVINFDSQNMTNVDIDSGTINGITDLAVADGGTGASNATNARSNLGLVIGTNVLAQQTIGIANDNLLEVDHASPADDDYAKFTANGLEGRSYTEVVSDLSLDTRRLFNLCRNAAFASRSGGTSAKPDEWELEGSPTVAYDTVDPSYGDYAVKLTATGAGDEGQKQTLTHLKISTKYQIFARVKVDAGDTASLITTGATTNINVDSTSESWEDITGEFITDGSATDVVIKLVASANTDVAYFCGVTCVEGNIPPANFIRRVNETIYLTTPITDTSWDSDGYSSAEADLDLSAFGNGCPPKIKAVFVSTVGRDSASSSGAAYFWLGVGGVALTVSNVVGGVNCTNQPDDTPLYGYATIPCNGNGDIRYKIAASGANTFDCWLAIWGYVLGE